MQRAEALCQVAATQGAYRLSGSNCEHIANWCKSGAHESKQVRYVHAGHAVISFGFLVALGRGPSQMATGPHGRGAGVGRGDGLHAIRGLDDAEAMEADYR